MNFSSLEYFQVLCQERNFTRASERLHLTQQSLSAHIAGLEKELGCQLIVRHVPLELTYGGKALLQYAESFLKAHEAMRREFCDISQNQKGVLRVGAGAARGQILLPKAIARFQSRFPHIRIDLVEGANDALHQALLQGTVDLAIADFPKAMPGVVLRDFYREEVTLVISREFLSSIFGPEADRRRTEFAAGNFAALKECPLVLGTAEDVDGRIALELLKELSIDRPLIAAQSHNVGTLLKLALSGVGGCFCPRNIVNATLTAEQKKTVLLFSLGERVSYPIRFGFKESAYPWSVIDTFMNCAVDALSA